MGGKNKGDTNSGGGIGNNTIEVNGDTIGVDTSIELIERSALNLGMPRILRKVLEM